MLYDDLDTLGNICFVQLNKPSNLPFRTCGLHFGIFLYLLVDLIEGLVSGIILQYIEDKAFLDSLLHRIHMERFTLSVRIDRAEKL